MARFVVPPGWPAPPSGWVPPAGWQPDRSWPPAPHGWQFWVDDGAAAPRSEPKKGLLAAHREAKVHDRYQHDLAEWTEDDEELASCIEAAESFDGFEPSAASGFVLKACERPFLLIRGAALIEPRATPGHWRGASQGVSFRVAKGVRYRVGQSRGTFVPGPTTPTPIDLGDALVTGRRVLFRGPQATREWLFDKMVGYAHSDDNTWTSVQVSNRQKTSGIAYGADNAHEFQFRLELALAVWRGDRGPLVAALEAQRAEHAIARPILPG